MNLSFDLWSISSNFWSLVLLVAGCVLLTTLGRCIHQRVSKSSGLRLESTETKLFNPENTLSDLKDCSSAYNEIPPLSDFEWSTTEPKRLRPFKPKFHMTMGLVNMSFAELLEMDKNYLTRIQWREKIIRDNHEMVIQSSPLIAPAVNELYIYLISIYLPSRFPTMFTLTPDHILNKVTGKQLPNMAPKAPTEALELLGTNIDEDFLLMLPSSESGEYVLQAFVACSPSGFDTRKKFGLRLREIHGPVPGYEAKLAKSMDRYFERLECGKLVGRLNWAIQTHGNLFAPTGNHLYEGQDTEVKQEKVDIANTYLRCERQTLWRLPSSKAIVFSFKTYMYDLQQIKNEGLGEDLAQAIDGIREGSVPAMHHYKKSVVWGDSVKEFLRS